MREAVIVSAVRTPVGRSIKGTLKDTRPEFLGALVVKEVLNRVPEVDPGEVEDVIFGCSFPEGEQGLNIARIVALKAGLPDSVPGLTVNRFCSSGLQAIALTAQQIISGAADIVVAGGVESLSTIPIGGIKPSPDPELMDIYPEVYTAMGQTAENVAHRYNITRTDQDAFAVDSHQKTDRAIKKGHFKNEIIPVPVVKKEFKNNKVHEESILFTEDEGIRASASIESLGKLRPVFHRKGTVTAGNSSPLTDGAAAVLIMSAERAQELGVKPLAKFISFAVGGVAPDEMGIGPVVAIPKALQKAGLFMDQIDVIELNEAFAAQALYCIRELGLDISKVNPNGGAIAMGHPLGCTGCKLTVTLINELHRRNGKYGMVSMCIGGGMGAAGIFEKM